MSIEKQQGKVKSLKSQLTPSIWAFIVVNVAAFWCILMAAPFQVESLDRVWKQFAVKDGLLAALVPIITLVGNGLLTSRAKETLVFWRRRHVLPGSRAFSDLGPADPRIDMARLEHVLGALPSDPAEQNTAWFRLYKKHEFTVVVLDSHKRYLLARDLAGLGFLFLCLLPIAMLLSENALAVKVGYSTFAVTQYLALVVVGRNYGNRFVCNVLAEESALPAGDGSESDGTETKESSDE